MNISKRIISIVAETFEISEEKISLETSPANTPEWDSFAQMSLVLNIETEFNIVLEFEEIFQIVSLETLIDLVERKLQI